VNLATSEKTEGTALAAQSPADGLSPEIKTTAGEPVPRHSRYILRPPPISTKPAKSSWAAAGPEPARRGRSKKTRRAMRTMMRGSHFTKLSQMASPAPAVARGQRCPGPWPGNGTCSTTNCRAKSICPCMATMSCESSPPSLPGRHGSCLSQQVRTAPRSSLPLVAKPSSRRGNRNDSESENHRSSAAKPKTRSPSPALQ
jgi:hypothetical protein